MVIKLFDSESFSKWISQILSSIDLLKVDVTSIYDLPDKMKAVQNMFSALIGPRLLGLSNDFSIVAI